MVDRKKVQNCIGRGGTPHMKMGSNVLIYLESKTKPGVVNTGLQKNIYLEGGTPHILC